ncbi:MAG: SAM-dependent methyltransferase [Acidimicrobiia bacterium]
MVNNFKVNGQNFSDYMQNALYGEDGFYTKGNGAGRERDYLTSPEVGELFGLVISDYIQNWFNNIETEKANVVEIGSGPGSLAASIARSNKDFLENINYFLVDISPEHRETSKKKLQNIKTVMSWNVFETIPETEGSTLIIANELLDNLVFDIGFTHDIYQEYQPDRLNVHEVMAKFGVFGNIDLANKSNVSTNIDNFPVPIHTGISNWLGEVIDACSQVTALELLMFDYIKSVESMKDGNWLRLYQDNKRIVGVENVLNALNAGACGDITTDIIKEDLMLALDLNGFSKITFDDQKSWLEKNGIDAYVNTADNSSYDQLKKFIENDTSANSNYGVERNLLTDLNGLGAFGVVSAKREI